MFGRRSSLRQLSVYGSISKRILDAKDQNVVVATASSSRAGQRTACRWQTVVCMACVALLPEFQLRRIRFCLLCCSVLRGKMKRKQTEGDEKKKQNEDAEKEEAQHKKAKVESIANPGPTIV